MFNDNTHHKCASIVGWLNLQAPSIATVVTVGRSRQSTSNDPCSDNWNTYEQVTVINTSSLNKSYVGGRMQIGHNRAYSAPKSNIGKLDDNNAIWMKFRHECKIWVYALPRLTLKLQNSHIVLGMMAKQHPSSGFRRTDEAISSFPTCNWRGYFVKPAILYNIDNVWHGRIKRDYYSHYYRKQLAMYISHWV